MKRNVLVFPCGSEIGLEIYRSLSFSTHFNLIGGSSVDDHGKFVYKNYIGNIPSVDQPDFFEELKSIINEYEVDFIFPAHDSVVLKLAQESEAGNLSCEVITSPIGTCEIARSKLKTYETFEQIVPVPKVYKSIEEIGETDLPIFLKPNIGQGSKGTHLARTINDVEYLIDRYPGLLIMEYLPGKEYTVDCFTNKNGELIFCEGRVRSRVMNGISVNTVKIEDKNFKSIADKINSHIKFRGVWFFQLKQNYAGELTLMEIAPRVAGTMALVRSQGVNMPLLSLFDRLDYDVEIFENRNNLVIDRALDNKYQHDIKYSHVYLDFDDLVIIDGKVNPAIMAFVYQCMNKKIQVHLLTRHREDLEKSLIKYRLGNIFDELIWLKSGEDKSSSIKHKDAIFIDDSFAERKKVHDALGIPVFDAHGVEALMEKF